LDVDEAMALFDILDHNSTGDVTLEELVAACTSSNHVNPKVSITLNTYMIIGIVSWFWQIYRV
jgi:Ca2+-binding EF-hand superfamily protein